MDEWVPMGLDMGMGMSLELGWYYGVHQRL